MASQISNGGASGLVKLVAADLDRPQHDWWRTAAWQRIRTDHSEEPFVRVLAAFAARLKAGVDVAWLTGGSTGTDAVTMSVEWITAGVDPDDVEAWLSTGCWSANTARRLADANLAPGDLMTAAGPLMFASAGRAPAPLAECLLEGVVSVKDAVAYIRSHDGGPA